MAQSLHFSPENTLAQQQKRAEKISKKQEILKNLEIKKEQKPSTSDNKWKENMINGF